MQILRANRAYECIHCLTYVRIKRNIHIMIKTTEDCFEDLAKSYPELMEKAHIGEDLGVDVGWFTIIDALCGCIYSPLSSAKSRLKAATEYPREDDGKYLAECEARYKLELENLPTIMQVKEKFAGLRFYVSGSDDRIEALIEFAERMSRHTCEKCGAPGELDDGTGWMKTHCKKHFGGSISEDEDLHGLHNGRVSAKFQDGEV